MWQGVWPGRCGGQQGTLVYPSRVGARVVCLCCGWKLVCDAVLQLEGTRGSRSALGLDPRCPRTSHCIFEP